MPLQVFEGIAGFCRQNNYKLHLDGAKIHLASGYQNISILAYSSYFNTVYLFLYKYLNAVCGVILCGEAKIIDQVFGCKYNSWGNNFLALD